MDACTSEEERRGEPEFEAAINSLNRTPAHEAGPSRVFETPAADVISKIEWLESELVQQKKNFENVDRRFVDLSSQIAALCNAITRANDQSPAFAAESMNSADGVSDTAGDASLDGTSESVALVDRLEDSSPEQDSVQLLEVRTRGAVSLDNLLAKLNAIDSDCENGTKELPQSEGNLEPESILSECLADNDTVAQQKNKLEELFASLRGMDEERQVDDSLIASGAVDTLNDNRLKVEPAEETECNSAGSESTEPIQESGTDLFGSQLCLPESDGNATVEQEPRLQNPSVVVEESPAAEESVRLPEPFVAKNSAARPGENFDGEDVQDYMNSLLQRLNGGEPAKLVPEVNVAFAVPSATTTTDSYAQPESMLEVERLKPDEFLPKRVAPEKNANMTAMRELANASSRSAVKSSALRRQKANSHLQLLMAGGGIAGAAFTSALSQFPRDLFFYLSIGLLVISVASIYCYARAHILGQNSETDSSDVDPQSGEPAGFDWSKLNEFTTAILSKLNRSPKASS